MSDRRFVNPAQPQTLQIAVILLYLNGFFELLGALAGGGFGIIGLAVVAGDAGGAYGIANEKKWGYVLGVVMAILPFALRWWVLGNPLEGAGLLNLLFEIALVALLVHPQSRDYQRIWFK